MQVLKYCAITTVYTPYSIDSCNVAWYPADNDGQTELENTKSYESH